MKIIGLCLSIITVAALTFILVAAGLLVCCFPPTTQILAQAYSGSENTSTPFSHDELIRAALATRDYTVGTHDQAAVMGVISALNQEARTKYSDTSINELSLAPNHYTLDKEALLHLDDVYHIVKQTTLALGIVAALCFLLFLFWGMRFGRQQVGSLLLIAGALVMALFICLGIGATFNFDGFFTAFHGLFFSQGTWTFSPDSLLITLYPSAFWMGMGGVWLVTTSLLSILAIITGLYLRREKS